MADVADVAAAPASVRQGKANASSRATGALFVAGLCYVAMLGLSLFYLRSYIKEWIFSFVYRNPLNAAALDYKVSKAIGLQLEYGYAWFVVLALVMFVAAGWGLYTTSKSGVAAPPTVALGLVLMFVQGAVSVLVNTGIFLAGRKSMIMIRFRREQFNKHIYDHLFKKSYKFLKVLSQPQGNLVASYDAIKKALRHAAPSKVRVDAKQVTKDVKKVVTVTKSDMSADDLARMFFTVNIYAHFQKIGVRNPLILDAMSTFSPLRLLSRLKVQPADYLFRTGTFIADVSETTMLMLPADMRMTPDDLDEALAKVGEWTAIANNHANSIYPEEASGPFLKLAAYIFAAQWMVPLAFYTYVLKDPVRKAAFIDTVMQLFTEGSVPEAPAAREAPEAPEAAADTEAPEAPEAAAETEAVPEETIANK